MSQKSEWAQFVKWRRNELASEYPCAAPTHRRRCPKHTTGVGPTTRSCKPCRDELYERLAAEYLNDENRRIRMTVRAAQGRSVEPERRVSTFPGPRQKPLPGQLSLLGDGPTNEEEMTMNTTSSELAERELLPAVVDEPLATPTLFGTSDPRRALEAMSDVATVLVDVIKDRKLYARISGHEHITAEGWTTLGAMLGVVPIVEWTRPNETGDGYVARVEARTLDGRVVGAAESECSRAERRWKTADPYAIRSMAQTRAIGRALRAPLGQIVVLAGYEPAPAEEMPVLDRDAEHSPPTRGAITPEPKPTDDQVAELLRLIDQLGAAWPEIDWKSRAKEIAGVPGDRLTRTSAEILLDKLKDELEETSFDGDAAKA